MAGVLLNQAGLPIFTFEVVERSSNSLDVQWTEFPIEAGSFISDHAFSRPEQIELSGRITATPFAVPGINLTRLTDIHRALKNAAKARQPVTLVERNEVTTNVGISNVKREHDRENGESYGITVRLQSIDQQTVESTQIPPGRIRPSSAKTIKKGGANSGKNARPKVSSILVKLFAGAGIIKR